MSRVNGKKPAALAPRATFHLADFPVALSWHPAGHSLAVASIAGPLVVLSESGASETARYPGHPGGTQCMAWHPDGRSLWSGGQDGAVRQWAMSGEMRNTVHPLGKAWVDRLSWNPNGHWCAAACGRVLNCWNADAAEWHSCEPHGATIADLAWSPKADTLASVSYGGVWLWTPGARTPARRLEWKGSSLVVAWSPTAEYLATGDQDASVHFWFVENGKDARMWGYPAKVRELVWDASGRYLATGGGPDVCVWDCSAPGPEGRDPILCQCGKSNVSALAWSREHSLLAAGYRDGKVVFWQPTRTVLPMAEIKGDAEVVHLAWSPDESALAIARADGSISLL